VRRTLILLLTIAIAVTGCTGEPAPKPPLRPHWHAVTLPVPPGPAGRLAVRDAVKCDGRWYVVGGVFTGPGESRPAAWRSADGRTWANLKFAPRWYWAHRNVIASVACHDGRIAMLGAKSGGAHGNPRVSTWYERPDGVYTDVLAAFSQYGGDKAVNVARLAAGDTGWMIAGNRMTGAAVWRSSDATEFQRIDSDPELSSDPTYDTAAIDLTYADGSWTVVGSAQVTGRVARTPLAWTSPDGARWHRQKVPYGKEYADLQRVIPYPKGVLAVGIHGQQFGAWRRVGTTWRRLGRFGKLDPDAAASPFVSGLCTAGKTVVATISDGSRYQVWAATDGAHWRRVATPEAPSTAGEHVMTAVGAGDEMLLLTDDGKTGRAYAAGAPR